jgi:hypothetical protein
VKGVEAVETPGAVDKGEYAEAMLAAGAVADNDRSFRRRLLTMGLGNFVHVAAVEAVEAVAAGFHCFR